MARAFVEAHDDAITGTLSMVDRLIFKGHFMSFYPRGSFAAFLARQGIQMKAFGQYVRRVTSIRLKASRPITVRRILLLSYDPREFKSGMAFPR